MKARVAAGELAGLADAGRLQAATRSTGGAVLGVAREGSLVLAYLGSVHAPFPNFPGEHPLDDPDLTARALLGRFLDLGVKFLDGLVGHFAVMVADEGAGRVLVGRMPKGSVRWFLSQQDDSWCFATRLADFTGLLGPRLEFDRSLEDFLLGYEFLPDDRTVFRGVSAVGAGKLVELTKDGRQEYSIAAGDPWEGAFSDVDLTDEAQVIDALHGAFLRAVQDQMPAGKRVGVLLGGVDSALIAATLRSFDKEVHTYSFAYPEDEYNQRFTDRLAELYGTHHHWVPITPEVMRDGIENYAKRFNQVVGQPHYVLATAEVCRFARENGERHCLTGDGCDGLFLGYPTVHFRAKLIQGLSGLAPLIAGPIGLLTNPAWVERQFGHPVRIARNVGQILRRKEPVRGHIAASTLDRRSLSQLRLGDNPPQERDAEAILDELAQGLDRVGPIRRAYLGKGRVGLNMTKLEGAATWSGVTLNSPYVHPGMAGVAGRIPDDLSRKSGDTKSKSTGKYAFLQMIERKGMLPSEIVYQPKQSPVTAPVDSWYWGELRSFMLQRLESLPFRYDRDYAESLIRPKLAEHWFRERVGISRYVTPAVALLTTYAAYSELLRRP